MTEKVVEAGHEIDATLTAEWQLRCRSRRATGPQAAIPHSCSRSAGLTRPSRHCAQRGRHSRRRHAHARREPRPSTTWMPFGLSGVPSSIEPRPHAVAAAEHALGAVLVRSVISETYIGFDERLRILISCAEPPRCMPGAAAVRHKFLVLDQNGGFRFHQFDRRRADVGRIGQARGPVAMLRGAQAAHQEERHVEPHTIIAIAADQDDGPRADESAMTRSGIACASAPKSAACSGCPLSIRADVGAG